MDTTTKRKKIQYENPLESIYNHDLSMFRESPGNVIALEEFEELALERLQVLRIVEEAALKGHKMYSKDWKNCINEDLVKNNLKKYKRLLNGYSTVSNVLDIQARRADHLSHYILRLAYCRSDDLRKWFITREMEWFRLKFSQQSHEGIRKFLQQNNLAYSPIDADEKCELREYIIESTFGMTDALYETSDFYKVPFQEVLPLVKGHKIFLKLGFGYIPTNELVVCILSKFRAELSESLSIYCRRLPLLDDDRLNRLLSTLHNVYTGKSYVRENYDQDAVNPEDMDMLAKQHFPMCMQHIHNVFRTEHHLKHNCRLVYSLFLKGIGLLYEDAMEYWRKEFTKKMEPDQFEKNYSYNIRHTYGKAGRMVNYSPYSCHKIIMENVAPGQHHGCPFKHWDATIVKQKLEEKGFGSEDVKSVMSLVSSGHYQIACTKYFQIMHGVEPSNTISHPNQFYSESVAVAKEKNKKKN